MELGQRLKQARLDAGLSQRQLCGDQLTRNMLSLIENGTARPSMDTLLYLAARLEKPVSYFLEEKSLSPNQARLAAARDAFAAGDPAAALAVLDAYEAPDPDFDPEQRYLAYLCRLYLAEAHQTPLPRMPSSPYCSPEIQWRWLLVQGDAAMAAGDLQTALKWFSLAEPLAPERAWPRLEKCCEQLEDYKQAYHYACLQREQK